MKKIKVVHQDGTTGPRAFVHDREATILILEEEEARVLRTQLDKWLKRVEEQKQQEELGVPTLSGVLKGEFPEHLNCLTELWRVNNKERAVQVLSAMTGKSLKEVEPTIEYLWKRWNEGQTPAEELTFDELVGYFL